MKKLKQFVWAGSLSLLLFSGAAVPAFGASPQPTPPEGYATARNLTPDLASADDNGLYWIDRGQTYRSGAVLQFYATGDGYGPEEPQELDPKDGSTRYIPVDWSVSTTSSQVVKGSRKIKGTWNKYSEETMGHRDNGNYVPGEYRYKNSFQLNTTGISSVPFTLRVKYQRQTYDERKGWRNDGNTAYKSVNFYIRNVSGADVKKPENLVGLYRTRKQIIYRITGAEKAAVMTPQNRAIESVDIPGVITVDGFRFKVTSISEGAFSGCARLKRVSIGKNVKVIGKNAFYGSKKLASVSFKTTKLTQAKVGSSAFKGIKRTCKFSFPPAKKSLYEKIVKLKGFRK